MDKTERLLRMMDRPENYSEEEWREILADETCRELYEAMRLTADAFEMEDAKAKLAEGMKEEEWKKLSEKTATNVALHAPLRKVAAAFIGVLMLSGIAYAAIHFFSPSFLPSPKVDTPVTASADTTVVSQTAEEETAVATDSVRVFEDQELATILSEMATFYQLKTVYKNEAVKHVRLYFTWNKATRIDDVIETFNRFERIHITREENKLIVK